MAVVAPLVIVNAVVLSAVEVVLELSVVQPANPTISALAMSRLVKRLKILENRFFKIFTLRSFNLILLRPEVSKK